MSDSVLYSGNKKDEQDTHEAYTAMRSDRDNKTINRIISDCSRYYKGY